jgi:multiple sugar transport system permease protein
MTRFGAAVLFLLAGAARADDRLALSADPNLLPWKGQTAIANRAARIMFEGFIRANPGVEIVAFESPRLPGVHSNAAQVMSIAGSAGPEIAQLFFPDLAGYVREGLIQPLDDLFEEWTGKNRWPRPLEADLELEGRKWGVVSGASYALLAADRTALGDAGLTPANMPSTWDDAVALAAKLSVPGRRAGFGIAQGKPVAFLWMAVARQAGGDEAIRLTPRGLQADLTAEPCRRAARFIADLGGKFRQAGPGVLKTYTWSTDVRRALVDRTLALALTTDTEVQEMFPARPVLSPVPGVFFPDPVAYATAGRLAVIPGFVNNALHRKLAWEFHTQFMWGSRELDAAWLELAARTDDRIPPIFSVWYPDHVAVKNLPPDWGPAVQRAIASARPMPPDFEFDRLADMLGTRLTKLLVEGGDPDAVLRETQAEFDSTVRITSRRGSVRWRVIGWGVLVLFAAALGWGIWRLAWDLKDELLSLRAAPVMAMTPRRWLVAAGFFAPAVLLAVGFGVIPLIRGLNISLYDHVLRNGGTFTGLGNYFDVIVNPVTHGAALRTIEFLGLSFLMGFVAPLLLALALSGLPFGRLVIRTAFFFPAVANAVVVAMIWQQLYGGPFNSIVAALGFAPRDWLGNTGTAMFAVVLAQAWNVIGVSGLIYIAGLASIPEALYEEAELEGAGLFERFVTVTWPHIKPLVGIGLVGWFIAAARSTEHFFLMTGGGPAGSTYILGLDIFTQAYVNIRFGYALAEVWLMAAVILAFSIYQMRAVRRGQLRLLGE